MDPEKKLDSEIHAHAMHLSYCLMFPVHVHVVVGASAKKKVMNCVHHLYGVGYFAYLHLGTLGFVDHLPIRARVSVPSSSSVSSL